MLKIFKGKNGRKGNDGAGTSKIKTSQLVDGGGNPEVAFTFKTNPNSVEEMFKVQLFSRNNNFLGLIRNQMYNGSYIQKEGDNEVKLNCVVNNSTPPGISPGKVQGDQAMGAGVVFLTAESSIIISSSETKTKDSKKLAKKHEAVGRIVNDNSSIDGTAIHRILSSLQSVPPKSVSIIRCYLVMPRG